MALNNGNALLHEVPGAVVAGAPDQKRRRYRWMLIGGVVVLITVLVAVLVPVGLLVIKKDKDA